MKIKYLGTAAAEGVPALFCRCEVCRKSREAGGRNIRSRSQSIIDDRLLIDFSADTFWHSIRNGLDLISINSCLITHAHEDHLYPPDIPMRIPGYAHFGDRAVTPLNFYGSDTTLQWIRNLAEYDELISKNVIALHPVRPYEPFEVEGYTVTALKADHDQKTDPFIYIISDGKKSLLYAHDTDIFPDETWEYLEKSGVKLSYVSLDCTEGTREIRYRGHMYLGRNIEARRRLTETGAADENTLFCLNHFSHNAINACYDDMKPIADENGFLLSFDGAEFEF